MPGFVRVDCHTFYADVWCYALRCLRRGEV